jgi:hypothetical protein
MTTHAKKPWIAFVLSLILPGAGLCYLDKWFWGMLNFLIVQAVLLGIVLLPVGQQIYESFHYVLLVLAAASAGVAHAVATQMLQRASGVRAGVGRGNP